MHGLARIAASLGDIFVNKVVDKIAPAFGLPWLLHLVAHVAISSLFLQLLQPNFQPAQGFLLAQNGQNLHRAARCHLHAAAAIRTGQSKVPFLTSKRCAKAIN